MADRQDHLSDLEEASSRATELDGTLAGELLQEGVVGLLRALERYEPERGVPCWSYAVWWVRQAMQQLVSELTRPAVLSDRALRHLARLRDAHHEVAESGGEPSTDALARRSGLGPDQVADLLAVDRAPRSLDTPMEGGEVGTFGDLVAEPLAEAAYEDALPAIEVADLRTLLSGLSRREREVLRERFGLGGRDEASLRDIGRRSASPAGWRTR